MERLNGAALHLDPKLLLDKGLLSRVNSLVQFFFSNIKILEFEASSKSCLPDIVVVHGTRPEGNGILISDIDSPHKLIQIILGLSISALYLYCQEDLIEIAQSTEDKTITIPVVAIRNTLYTLLTHPLSKALADSDDTYDVYLLGRFTMNYLNQRLINGGVQDTSFNDDLG